MYWGLKWYCDENEKWFVDGEVDFLYRSNKDGIFYSAYKIPNKGEVKWKGHPLCVKFDNSIFCFPDRSEEIMKYLPEENKWEEIELKKSDRLGINSYSIVREDSLLFFSEGLKQLLEIKRGSNLVEYIDFLGKKKDVEDNLKAYFDGTKCYILGCKSRHLYIYDYCDKIFETVSLDIDEELFSMAVYKNFIWACGYTRNVYQIDLNDGNVKKHIISNDILAYPRWNNEMLDWDYEVLRGEQPSFVEIVPVNDGVWLVPLMCNTIVTLNVYTGMMSSFVIKEEDVTGINKAKWNYAGRYTVIYYRDDRYIGLYSFTNVCVIEIDTVNMDYSIRKMPMSSEVYKEVMKNSSVIFETEKNKLALFVEII